MSNDSVKINKTNKQNEPELRNKSNRTEEDAKFGLQSETDRNSDEKKETNRIEGEKLVQTSSTLLIAKEESVKSVQAYLRRETKSAGMLANKRRSESRSTLSSLKDSFEHFFHEDYDFLKPVKFINIIFLPYNPTFKAFVLVAAILKSILGPLQAVYPFITCKALPQPPIYLAWVKFAYSYIVDTIYSIDIFFHIVHRQVVDEAMKREHMPKSMLLLLIDIISVLPIRRLVCSHKCLTVKLFPNIFAFNEIFVMYRIVDHFSLMESHSIINLTAGYVLFIIVFANGCACVILLFTMDGLCDSCSATTPFFDWRVNLIEKFPEITTGHGAYLLGFCYSMMLFCNEMTGQFVEITYTGTLLAIILVSLSFAFKIFVCIPKMFCELTLRMRNIYIFHQQASRFVEGTMMRNPSRDAFKMVEKFFSVTWEKSKGITSITSTIDKLPLHLREDINRELFLHTLFHSPVLRDTSESFQLYLSNYIKINYKLPGDRFFTERHCYTNLYYLKSGIVQFICMDDSTSPLLSVTGGTLLGDVSFYLPPLNRKVMVRCFTYCELVTIPRSKIIMAMHKYPEDRQLIMKLLYNRIKHARDLHACKRLLKISDRSEIEGVAWLKRHWWRISEALGIWKLKYEDTGNCVLPREEGFHHCAKYIGQLVLCAQAQLQRTSIFAKVTFPWILFHTSSVTDIWYKFIKVVVIFLIILFPPNCSRINKPIWFQFFKYCVDFLWTVDICVSLVTIPQRKEISGNSGLLSVMLTRWKRFDFILDVLASPLIDYCYGTFGNKFLKELIQFNRLMKVHILFTRSKDIWNWKSNPLHSIVWKNLLTQCMVIYIAGYLFFELLGVIPQMTTKVFFTESICSPRNQLTCIVDYSSLEIVKGWIFTILNFSIHDPKTYVDYVVATVIVISSWFIILHVKCNVLGALFLKNKHLVQYHSFVGKFKHNMLFYKVHPDLMNRLSSYTTCQFQYNGGLNVLCPINLEEQPHDIYWNYHGFIAEKIIGESMVFKNSNPKMIKQMARKAKFNMIPHSVPFNLFGDRVRYANWLVRGFVKLKYYDNNTPMPARFLSVGQLIFPMGFIIHKPALYTIVTETDCEILFIENRQFHEIIMNYPEEWETIRNVAMKLEPTYNRIFQINLKRHRGEHEKNKIKNNNESKENVSESNEEEKTLPILNDLKLECGNRSISIFKPVTMRFIIILGLCIKIWLFRAIPMSNCGHNLTVMMLPFYDDRGVIISDKMLCFSHYLARGFIADLLGALPVGEIVNFLEGSSLTVTQMGALDAITSYFHFYMITGLIDYYCAVPNRYYVILQIIKWNILIVLMLVTTGMLLLTQCLEFEWGEAVLKNMTRLDSCWIPSYIPLDKNPTIHQLHTVFATGIVLALSTQLKMLGFSTFESNMNMSLGIFLFVAIIVWFVVCHSQALLLLQFRGDDVYQHEVKVLVEFLTEERVSIDVIDRITNHYTNVWERTRGIDTSTILAERMNLRLRQDCNLFLYKLTLKAVDTILKGGEIFLRDLNCFLYQNDYLDKEDITREMELISNVYIVHRGRVQVIKDGVFLAVLSKGCIFGLLNTPHTRPVRITTTTMEPTDILELPVKEFHSCLSDEIKQNIAKDKDTQNDFMCLKEPITEDPHDTVEYLMRGKKILKLPKMKEPANFRNSPKYCTFLYYSYLWGTSLSIIVSFFLVIIPYSIEMLVVVILLDITYFLYFLSEFFTMRLVVENQQCVLHYNTWIRLFEYSFYLDIISLVLPIFAIIYDNRDYHMFRLLRLHCFYAFIRYFSNNFQFKRAPLLIKFNILFMMLHVLTCIWVRFSCYTNEPNSFFYQYHTTLTEEQMKTVDFENWILPRQKNDVGFGSGCLFPRYEVANKSTFIVLTKTWVGSYIISMASIWFAQMHYNYSVVVGSLWEIYLKIIISVVQYILDIWLYCVAISIMYTKYREFYEFDFKVRSFLDYLKINGISKALVKYIMKYTRLLWRRRTGMLLVDMMNKLPPCLREDMFSSLYIHHLRFSNIFADLPEYFLRQLAGRFKRQLIFPGNTIVKEGDVSSVIYFIHEGEVERWYSDAEGDMRMQSLLTQNTAFCIAPGIFQNVTNFHTFIARSVVDLVYLDRNEWSDLRLMYPDVMTIIKRRAKRRLPKRDTRRYSD